MSIDNSALDNLGDASAVEKITIEVVYGVPHKQKILTLLVDSGFTVEQGIVESGIIDLFPEIDQ